MKALCEHLAREGYRVTELPVDSEGQSRYGPVRRSLSPDTAVVSLMWANNETGVIFPVEEAAQLARERGILFHTDAVQAVGKIPINMKTTAIDMLSFSGHKLHAPKGIGVLYVERGPNFHPFSSAAIRKRDVAAAQKIRRASSALGRPVNWPLRIWRQKIPESKSFATGLKMKF